MRVVLRSLLAVATLLAWVIAKLLRLAAIAIGLLAPLTLIGIFASGNGIWPQVLIPIGLGVLAAICYVGGHGILYILGFDSTFDVPSSPAPVSPRVTSLSNDSRIAKAQEHLGAAGALLSELSDDLNTRIKVLEQVKSDAERYERLASLNREQADEIEDMVGRQLHRQRRSGVRIQWLFLVPAFALGLIINWISGPLLAWFSHLF